MLDSTHSNTDEPDGVADRWQRYAEETAHAALAANPRRLFQRRIKAAEGRRRDDIHMRHREQHVEEDEALPALDRQARRLDLQAEAA